MIYVHFTDISVGIWPKNKNICNSILNLPAILGKKMVPLPVAFQKSTVRLGDDAHQRIFTYFVCIFKHWRYFLSKGATASSPQNPVGPIQSIKHNPCTRFIKARGILQQGRKLACDK